MPEKKEFHEKEEEHLDEKWRKDPLGSIFSGLIIILIGVLLFLAAQDYIFWSDWWAYLLVGLGVIFLIEIIVRQTRPEYRRPVVGKLIAAVVLIAIGSGHIYGLEHWWPLIIIVVGFVILFFGFQRLRRP